MGRIQEELDGFLERELTLEKVLFIFLRKKLKTLGAVLNEEQERKLKAQLAGIEGASSLSIEADHIDGRPLTQGEEGEIERQLMLAIDDPRAVQEFSVLLEDSIHAALRKTVPDIAADVWRLMKSRSARQSTLLQRDRKKFMTVGMKPWREALSFLGLLISVSAEMGTEFSAELDQMDRRVASPLASALERLNARGCQVANEVCWLLEGGFADGAYARWRTLHEISCVASLLCEGGDDLARQYLAHMDIENYRIAEQYQQQCAHFGWEPLSESEFGQLRVRHDARLKEYGKEFAGSYGWAAKALACKAPKFSDIERRVQLGHMRPYFRLASHNVHAGAFGALRRVGLLDEEQESVLLAGSSNIGIAEPAYHTALSLINLSNCLLIALPNMDRAVAMHVLLNMQAEFEIMLTHAEQAFMES